MKRAVGSLPISLMNMVSVTACGCHLWKIHLRGLGRYEKTDSVVVLPTLVRLLPTCCANILQPTPSLVPQVAPTLQKSTGSGVVCH